MNERGGKRYKIIIVNINASKSFFLQNKVIFKDPPPPILRMIYEIKDADIYRIKKEHKINICGEREITTK